MTDFLMTEKQMTENAPFPVICDNTGKQHSTRLRTVDKVDEWLRRADEIDSIETDIGVISHAVMRVAEDYMKALQEAEVYSARGEEALYSEADDKAKALGKSAEDLRRRLRTRKREHLSAMFEAVCAYAPNDIPREEIQRNGVTDPAVALAFTRLKAVTDPFFQARTISALLAKSIRDTTRT